MAGFVLVRDISFSLTLTAASGRLSAGLARLLEVSVLEEVVVLPSFANAAPLPAAITPLLLSSLPPLPAVLPPRDLGIVVPLVPEPRGP